MSVWLTNDRKRDAELVNVGSLAPDFTLHDDQNSEWRLSDHLGKVVVLLFYPQNETLICTRQLCSVRDNWKSYLETKAEIVGISAASREEHHEFSRMRSLPIRLLADERRSVTRIYGRHWLYPIGFTRAVFVIDAKGIVCSKDIMLKVFRPSDEQIITDIYAARGDAFNDERNKLRSRLMGLISK